MEKRIELKENYVDDIGRTLYKSDDGLVYAVNKDGLFYKEEKYGPSACVGVDKDVRETIEHADIANEVVIEGKVYPVTHTMLSGFSSCKELTTITFPENMKCIVKDSIYMPGADFMPRNSPLPKLEKLTFNGCRDFENFEYYIKYVHEIEYDSVETLLNMYSDAPNKNIVSREPITSEVITIGGKELTELAIPEGTRVIRDHFFAKFASLRSLKLPASLKVISDSAFEGCENLEAVNLPDGLETIGKRAFEGTALREVTIPKGCKIGGWAFAACEQLERVSLPEDLTEIPDFAFFKTKIEGINLPESLLTIGKNAFEKTPLKEITIPSTVTSIGEYVFEGCGQLANVYSHIQDPAACDVQSMEEKQRSANYKYLEVFYCQATLHIPNVKGMATAYKKKAAWKKFSNIVADIDV